MAPKAQVFSSSSIPDIRTGQTWGTLNICSSPLIKFGNPWAPFPFLAVISNPKSLINVIILASPSNFYAFP